MLLDTAVHVSTSQVQELELACIEFGERMTELQHNASMLEEGAGRACWTMFLTVTLGGNTL